MPLGNKLLVSSRERSYELIVEVNDIVNHIVTHQSTSWVWLTVAYHELNHMTESKFSQKHILFILYNVTLVFGLFLQIKFLLNISC